MIRSAEYDIALARLSHAGDAWRRARHAERHAASVAKEAIRLAHHNHGVSEVEIAAVLQVDRQTVRRALGKLPRHAPISPTKETS